MRGARRGGLPGARGREGMAGSPVRLGQEDRVPPGSHGVQPTRPVCLFHNRRRVEIRFPPCPDLLGLSSEEADSQAGMALGSREPGADKPLGSAGVGKLLAQSSCRRSLGSKWFSSSGFSSKKTQVVPLARLLTPRLGEQRQSSVLGSGGVREAGGKRAANGICFVLKGWWGLARAFSTAAAALRSGSTQPLFWVIPVPRAGQTSGADCPATPPRPSRSRDWYPRGGMFLAFPASPSALRWAVGRPKGLRLPCPWGRLLWL